jgi:hypothetical protein
MRDRFGEEIEEIPEELPPDIPADDHEPEGPPDEYMTTHCELCDETGLRLNQLGRCDHVDYGAIARRHRTAIKNALKKKDRA